MASMACTASASVVFARSAAPAASSASAPRAAPVRSVSMARSCAFATSGSVSGRRALRASAPAAAVRVSAMMAELSDVVVPKGMCRYETMFLLMADASEEEIAKEVSKLEGFITEAGAVHTETLNRGRQPLAYAIKPVFDANPSTFGHPLLPKPNPVKKSQSQSQSVPLEGFPEAVYLQMNYVAPPAAAKHLETKIAEPTLGDRKLVMRFMTHNYSR